MTTHVNLRSEELTLTRAMNNMRHKSPYYGDVSRNMAILTDEGYLERREIQKPGAKRKRYAYAVPEKGKGLFYVKPVSGRQYGVHVTERGMEYLAERWIR